MSKDNFYKSLWQFLKPYKLQVFFIILLKVLILLCVVSIPYILGNVIKSLEDNNATISLLLKYLFVLVALYLLWNIMQVILEVIFEKVNKSVENDLRTYCYEAIIKSPMAKIQNKSEGEIITKVIKDTEKIEKTFSSVITFIDLLLHSIAIVFMMFIVNYILAGIILTLFLIIVIAQRLTSRPLKQYYKQYKISEERLLTDIKNQLTGFLSIKVLSLENSSIKLLKQRNEENLKNHMKIKTTASIIKNINYFMSSLFRISSLIIGGFLYINNKLKLGNIFTIYTYSIQLSNRIMMLIDVDILLKDIETSFNRISEFLAEFEIHNESETYELKKINSIEFKNVSYKYDEKQLFSNLSFTAKPGEVIGIKGGNGTGKTTLTYLICGFYQLANVYINGVSTTQYTETEILKRISYVLQNIHLFPASVIDNLTSFNRVTQHEAYKIAKEIGLHKKIIKLCKGYDTVVNEKNLNLSGGEKQLISLGQALLQDSDVLILDEINSALDLKTEDKLLNCITPYFKHKIVFIISHRQKVFDMCDKIIDLDKQEVIDCIKSIKEPLYL